MKELDTLKDSDFIVVVNNKKLKILKNRYMLTQNELLKLVEESNDKLFYKEQE